MCLCRWHDHVQWFLLCCLDWESRWRTCLDRNDSWTSCHGSDFTCRMTTWCRANSRCYRTKCFLSAVCLRIPAVSRSGLETTWITTQVQYNRHSSFHDTGSIAISTKTTSQWEAVRHTAVKRLAWRPAKEVTVDKGIPILTYVPERNG